MKRLFFLMMFIFGMVGTAFNVSANMVMDDIIFDPSIIAAGDEVDIIVQYHVSEGITEDNNERFASPDYKFHVELVGDDDLTRDYVTIQDSVGDNIHGASLFSGDFYKKRFTVKVDSDAPAGNYEFKLNGRWYKDGEPEASINYLRFKMPVKKEGIILNVANVITSPAEIRPGDDYVKIESYIENVGEKDSKSAKVSLSLPEGFEHSYSNQNRLWIGRLNAGESKKATFYVDIDKDLSPGSYNLVYDFDYMDVDENSYQIERELPLLVKSRPYLEVVASEGRANAGEDATLQLVVRNTGTESAEAVDVRILKQNSQPFTLDVRSDYIGELEPGEKGLAVFDIGVNRDAAVKEHSFKILIRAKGDSDEGDDRIYTFNRRAKFIVSGEAKDTYAIYGVGGLVAVLAVFGLSRFGGKNKK